jgi:hypothetical protein
VQTGQITEHELNGFSAQMEPSEQQGGERFACW